MERWSISNNFCAMIEVLRIGLLLAVEVGLARALQHVDPGLQNLLVVTESHYSRIIRIPHRSDKFLQQAVLRSSLRLSSSKESVTCPSDRDLEKVE